MYKTFCAVLSAVVVLVAGCGQQSAPNATTAVDPCFQNLPSGWSIEKSLTLDSKQTASIAGKLGVTGIKQVSNTFLLVEGKRLQINILLAENADAATKLHGALSGLKGDPAFCLINGTKVYEYVGDRTITADFVKKVSQQLGI